MITEVGGDTRQKQPPAVSGSAAYNKSATMGLLVADCLIFKRLERKTRLETRYAGYGP